MLEYTPMSNTLDEILNDCLDNADFEEQNSVVKAKRFVTAATKYLLLTPAQQSTEGTSLTMSVHQIENLLVRARDYIQAKDTSGNTGVGTRFLSGRNDFRW